MPSLPALRKQLVALALQIGENEGHSLDFSPASVEEVEKILASLHDYYRKTKNEEGLFGVALEFGAYIIEVLERNFPPKGRWRRDHPDLGKNTFPYEWRGATIFPVAWCQKRIWDGPGDDIVSKFELLVVRRHAELSDA